MINLLGAVILSSGYLAMGLTDSAPYADVRIELPQIQREINYYDAFFFDENPTLVIYPPGRVFDLTGYTLLFESGRLDILTGTIISAPGIVSTDFTLSGNVDGTEVSGGGTVDVAYSEITNGLYTNWIVYKLEEQLSALESQPVAEPSLLLLTIPMIIIMLRKRNA